jgi:hypothetical protein
VGREIESRQGICRVVAFSKNDQWISKSFHYPNFRSLEVKASKSEMVKNDFLMQ